MAPAKKPTAYDYNGEHFALRCLRLEGRVAMELWPVLRASISGLERYVALKNFSSEPRRHAPLTKQDGEIGRVKRPRVRFKHLGPLQCNAE